MHSDGLNKETGGSPASSPDELPEDRLNDLPNRLYLREDLDLMFEGLLFLSEKEFDAAIIGVAERIGMDAVVAYDTTKIIEILCERDGMDDEEAAEYFEFNIAGAYVGERTPIFIAKIKDILY